MFRTALFTAFLISGMVAAQEPGRPIGSPVVPLPYNEIRQYLVLSDAQIKSLEQVQANRREAEAAIYRQMAEKQSALNSLLQAGSTDALRIGQLTIELNNLRRGLPLSAEPYRSAALAVLTTEQKSKLQTLADALRLGPAAYEAVSFNLIDAPNRGIGVPVPLPMPMRFSELGPVNLEAISARP
jgi:hypothetical protein